MWEGEAAESAAGREGAALGCSIQAAGLEEGFFLPQSHSWFFFSSPSAIKWNFTKVGYSCLLQDLPGSHAPPLGGCGESLRCGREEGSSHLGSAVCSYPGCQGRSVPRGSCAVLVPVLRDPYKPLAWLSLALSQTGSNQLRGEQVCQGLQLCGQDLLQPNPTISSSLGCSAALRGLRTLCYSCTCSPGCCFTSTVPR